LGVVGDNGAGKSTFMKVLSGLYKPSSGSLFFDGNKEILNSPKDSQNLGLEMVYQDLALAGNLPIGENIFLGREPTKNFGFLKLLDYKKIKELSEAHLDKLKIHVKSAEQKVEELSGGQRQAIAIARATAFNSKIVIMDEPTAALAIKEVGKVLDLINSLKKMGVSVIIISHRMDDIFAVSDRVMALFQGTNFAESELSKTTRNEVIGWIMGKK
jgi:simple sugar transport system ATP-binding protein